METKFTEGEWKYSRNNVATPHELVANVFGFDTKEKQANGLLIAHAPQLLEMLNTLLTAIDNAELTDDDTEAIVPLMAKAEDLIKQATTINK